MCARSAAEAAALIATLGATAPAQAADEQFDLTEMMGGFTFVTFGDTDFRGGTLYGSAAVLGDRVTAPEVATISDFVTAEGEIGGSIPVIDDVGTMLLIGNQFVGGPEGRVQVIWGGVRIGDVSNLYAEELTSASQFPVRAKDAPGAQLQIGDSDLSGVMDSTSLDRVQIDDPASYVADKSEFVAFSDMLRSDRMLEADNVAIIDPEERTVTLTEGKINVLNSGPEGNSISLTAPPTAETPIVVNVDAGDADTVTVPRFFLDDVNGSAYIIVNVFADAPREVQIEKMTNGTLLAPELVVNLEETGRKDGLVIADGVVGLGRMITHCAFLADVTPGAPGAGGSAADEETDVSDDPAAEPAGEDAGVPVWVWVLGAGGVLAVAAGVAFAVARARGQSAAAGHRQK